MSTSCGQGSGCNVAVGIARDFLKTSLPIQLRTKSSSGFLPQQVLGGGDWTLWDEHCSALLSGHVCIRAIHAIIIMITEELQYKDSISKRSGFFTFFWLQKDARIPFSHLEQEFFSCCISVFTEIPHPCVSGMHDCHRNANCTAVPGSRVDYSCSCRETYFGNGKICRC